MFAIKASVQHQKERGKCIFVAVQTQGHAARFHDT